MSSERTDRPRILVTFGGKRSLDQWEAYASAVERAGGEPIAMDAREYRGDIDLMAYDGLLTTGGVDVDPVRYDEPRDPNTEPPFPERDEAEFALTRAAIDLDIPLFAIGRGFQVLNVVAGGSLHQHVHEVEGRRDHRSPKSPDMDVNYAPAHDVDITEGGLLHLEAQEPHRSRRGGDSGPYASGWHGVEVTPGSLLAQLSGETSMRVNSRHHQAVTPDRLAPGLLATARTEEGGIEIIEAVEVPGHTFALGVQWHPERAEMQDDARLDAGALRLFEGFMTACRMPRPAR